MRRCLTSAMAGSRYGGSKSRIAAMLEALEPQPWTEYEPLMVTSSESPYAVCSAPEAKLAVQRAAISVKLKEYLIAITSHMTRLF